MKVGDKVAYKGYRQWPYGAAHPDCWQPPHRGELVPYNDPRLWYHTLAFGSYSYPNGPTQEDVDKHVRELRERHDLPAEPSFGVIWEWTDKDGRNGTYFVKLADVVPYAEALAYYKREKAATQTSRQLVEA